MFGPHMLRKFPPQTGFANPKQHGQNQFMSHNMPPQFQNQPPNFSHFHQQHNQPMMNMVNQIDPNLMNPNDKRDYYGDQLFTKISSNNNFAQFEE